jgi:solute carrier family 25 S-adenosylmethionine transporter 26
MHFSFAIAALLLLFTAVASFHLDAAHLCFNDVNFKTLINFAIEGGIAGGSRALSRGLTFPFDTIKTLQQAGNSRERGDQKLRVKDYFNGIIPTVVSAIPANALFFVVYNFLEQFITCYSTTSGDHLSVSNNFIQRLIVSAIATIPQNLIKIPGELIKQRAQTRRDKSIVELFKEAVEQDGLPGLYVGGRAQLLREIPYNSIQMASFELLKDSSFASGSTSSYTAGVLGLLAAGIAAVLTQPVDVVKTRLMTSRSSEQLFPCVRRIYQEDGVQGFFVGLVPRLILVSIGGFFYFYFAQLSKELFDVV